MISEKVIKKYGLDSDSLKKVFTAKEVDEKVTDLIGLVRDRIQEGRTRNLVEGKIWAAVDIAYDTPFAQTTPTLVRNIMQTCNTEKEMLETLRGWGLSESNLFTCETTESTKKYSFNEPLFNQVFIPLVRAYLTIRLAKIFNDRNLTPLFEFAPREATAENRILCQILTEVVETVSTNMGYSAVLRDFIFKALMYSVSIKFPVEPWTKYTYEDDNGDKKTYSEGIRYDIPHVVRTFYDLNFPLATLNTDTGCAYAGYWMILRWGDVAKNPDLWNRKTVPHGTNWFDINEFSRIYFKEVYPCSLEFPKPIGARRTDREGMIGKYGKNDYDSALFVTYIFMKLNPSEWNLSDYDGDIWMRFMVASDDIIMFAEVFPYNPLNYIGYDSDPSRGRNASLALEIIPFQDIVGNCFSNMLLTIKRNLANMVFYDSDVVDEEQLKSFNRTPNNMYKGLNLVPYSGTKMTKMGKAPNQIFSDIKFAYTDPSQSLQGATAAIAMLERVLVVSPQEIGSSATHQQSKKEVEIANANTTNRVAYTASFVDEGIEGWKRQLLQAVRHYMDGNEVIASIPVDIPDLKANLKKLGFEFVDASPLAGDKKAVVKGKLNIESFLQLVSRRSDTDRENDQQTAQAMFTAITTLANSQFLSQVIDPTSLVQLIELAAKFAGADDGFEVRLNQNGMMAGQLQQVIGEVQKQIMASVEKEVAQPAATAIAQNGQKTDANSAAIQEMTGILEKLQKMIDSSQPLPPPSVSMKLPPPGGVPLQPPPVAPAGPAMPPVQLQPSNAQHVEMARAILAQAGGDKQKARQIAVQMGHKL